MNIAVRTPTTTGAMTPGAPSKRRTRTTNTSATPMSAPSATDSSGFSNKNTQLFQSSSSMPSASAMAASLGFHFLLDLLRVHPVRRADLDEDGKDAVDGIDQGGVHEAVPVDPDVPRSSIEPSGLLRMRMSANSAPVLRFCKTPITRVPPSVRNSPPERSIEEPRMRAMTSETLNGRLCGGVSSRSIWICRSRAPYRSTTSTLGTCRSCSRTRRPVSDCTAEATLGVLTAHRPEDGAAVRNAVRSIPRCRTTASTPSTSPCTRSASANAGVRRGSNSPHRLHPPRRPVDRQAHRRRVLVVGFRTSATGGWSAISSYLPRERISSAHDNGQLSQPLVPRDRRNGIPPHLELPRLLEQVRQPGAAIRTRVKLRIGFVQVAAYDAQRNPVFVVIAHRCSDHRHRFRWRRCASWARGGWRQTLRCASQPANCPPRHQGEGLAKGTRRDARGHPDAAATHDRGAPGPRRRRRACDLLTRPPGGALRLHRRDPHPVPLPAAGQRRSVVVGSSDGLRSVGDSRRQRIGWGGDGIRHAALSSCKVALCAGFWRASCSLAARLGCPCGWG